MGAPKPIEILDARLFNAVDRSSLRAWLDQQAAGRVLVVVPSSQIICRTFQLPNASPAQLQAALNLQAEAHLLGAIPPHRLGLCVLPSERPATNPATNPATGSATSSATGSETGAEGHRTGLLIGWPESVRDGSQEQPFHQPPAGATVSHVADLAGLAGLLGTARPSQPVLWLDRSVGAVAIAVACGDGLAMRATREEFSDESEWRSDVARVVSETLLGSGQPATVVRDAAQQVLARLGSLSDPAGGASDGASDAGSWRRSEPGTRQVYAGSSEGANLLLPEDLLTRLDGEVTGSLATHSGSDQSISREAWWSRFGIAIGAVRCLTSDLEPLTHMQAVRAEVRPSVIARTALALSQPRTAAALAVLGLVAVAFGPLAFAALRGAILERKVPDVEALRGQNLEDEKLRKMYRELGRQTWPMSKLLADISNAAPQGVKLRSVVIDKGGGVTVEGIATGVPGQPGTGVDKLEEMAKAMTQTGVFSQVRYDRVSGASMGGSADIRITANVVDPFRRHDWPVEQDFNVTSLAMRMHGKETTPGVTAPGETHAGRHEAGRPAAAASLPADSSPPPETSSAGLPEAAAAPRQAIAAMGPSRRDRSEGNASSEGPADEGASAERGAEESAEEASGEASGEAVGEAGGESGSENERGDSSRGDRRAITRRGESGRASGAASRGDQPIAAASTEIPEPLSDQAIAAMDRDQAQQMLAKLAKARQSPSLKDEERTRLRDEFTKVMAHMTSLPPKE
jgi:hypothetical protein